MKNQILALTVGLMAALLLTDQRAQAMTFEDDVPTNVVTQVNSDLQFVQSIQGSQASPLHKAVFGAVDGATYMKWFNNRVETFGYRPVSSTQPTAIAFNDSGSTSQVNHMVVTDDFAKGDLPQVARLITLFHEARHSEANHGYWLHVNCPSPFVDAQGNEIKSIFSGLPIAGLPGCDNVAEGAYGIAVIMMENVAKSCTNCNEKLKGDADLYAKDQINRLMKSSDREQLQNDLGLN